MAPLSTALKCPRVVRTRPPTWDHTQRCFGSREYGIHCRSHTTRSSHRRLRCNVVEDTLSNYLMGYRGYQKYSCPGNHTRLPRNISHLKIAFSPEFLLERQRLKDLLRIFSSSAPPKMLLNWCSNNVEAGVLRKERLFHVTPTKRIGRAKEFYALEVVLLTRCTTSGSHGRRLEQHPRNHHGGASTTD